MRLVPALLAALAACTTVTRDMETGAVIARDVTLPGAAPVCPESTHGVVVEARALGLWRAGGEGGFGWRAARYACLPADCHFVVFADDETDAAALRSLLADLDTACIAS